MPCVIQFRGYLLFNYSKSPSHNVQSNLQKRAQMQFNGPRILQNHQFKHTFLLRGVDIYTLLLNIYVVSLVASLCGKLGALVGVKRFNWFMRLHHKLHKIVIRKARHFFAVEGEKFLFLADCSSQGFVTFTFTTLGYDWKRT